MPLDLNSFEKDVQRRRAGLVRDQQVLVLPALSPTVATSDAAQSAPFGVRPGMSLRQLDKLVPLEAEEDYWYVSTTTPESSAGFSRY